VPTAVPTAAAPVDVQEDEPEEVDADAVPTTAPDAPTVHAIPDESLMESHPVPAPIERTADAESSAPARSISLAAAAACAAVFSGAVLAAF
jgi:hypothetical protein